MKAVFGLASSPEQAHKAVDQMLKAGFSNGDISILFPDKDKHLQSEYEHLFAHGDADAKSHKRAGYDSDKMTKGDRNFAEDATRENHPTTPKKKHGSLATEASTKAPEGGVTGATAGGVIGGTLGLLAGIGALAIPGVGPFIAAGPLMAALGGSAVGGSLGLLLGAIVGYGIPEYEAKRYEEGVKAGKILVSVCTANDSHINETEEIMKRNGFTDISASSEVARSKH